MTKELERYYRWLFIITLAFWMFGCATVPTGFTTISLVKSDSLKAGIANAVATNAPEKELLDGAAKFSALSYVNARTDGKSKSRATALAMADAQAYNRQFYPDKSLIIIIGGYSQTATTEAERLFALLDYGLNYKP